MDEMYKFKHIFLDQEKKQEKTLNLHYSNKERLPPNRHIE